MCFSATASIAAAAGTGIVGALTIGKATTWREAPLAAIPLAFAVQQAMEGALWLVLAGPHPGELSVILANGFAIFALVVWPLYTPVASALVENASPQKFIMLGLVVLALPLAVYGATNIAAHPYSACIVKNSLSYANGASYPNLALGAYVACTCIPLVSSSHKALRWFGVIVVAGLIASTQFYIATQFSVWCFFAAAGSITVHLHFSLARRRSTNDEPNRAGQ